MTRQLSEDECLKKIAGYMDIVNQDLTVERDSIEIKPSKLGGNGLFAKEFIPEGSLIVHYPPNIVSIDKYIYNCKDLYEGTDAEGIEKLAYECDDYRVIVMVGEKPLMVWADPNFKNNANFIGHMINDKGFKIKKTYKPELNNSHFNGLDIVSTKDIKAGDEIGLTYGSEYWYTEYNGLKSRNMRLQKIKM